MTFFYFVTCALLTFGPVFVAYHSTQLAEAGALGSCLWAGVAYAGAAAARLMAVAVAVPAGAGQLTSEVLHAVLGGLADAAGLHVALAGGARGSPELRVLAAALGWAAADAAATRLLPLWLRARAPELDPTHLRSALEANVHLLLALAAAAAVWLAGRPQAPRRVAVAVAAAALIGVPLGQAIARLYAPASWFPLLLSAVTAAALALLARRLHRRHVSVRAS